MPATTCTSCGYNAPWHALDCTATTTVFRCQDHAPAGVKAEPFDDGKERCDICGTFGSHVKPYRP